ncbi:MAG: TetR/AcrR family transcriptional regulator [Caldilineaceae bacterium]
MDIQTNSQSDTRTNLLDAAMQLMLEKGFTATSVDEICKLAGVTKGSFFYYFGSKEELGNIVLKHFQQMIGEFMQQGPHRAIADPLARIYAYCDFLGAMILQPQTPKSCLIGNLSQEMAPTNPAIAATCQAIFAWWTELMLVDLEKAKERYAPQKEIDCRALAEHFIVVFEGALILAKAQQDFQVVAQHIGHFKSYLACLLGQPTDALSFVQ